jgi:hypothetical protein
VINHIPSTLIKDSSEKTIDNALTRIDAICEALPKLCHDCQLIVKESVAKTKNVASYGQALDLKFHAVVTEQSKKEK